MHCLDEPFNPGLESLPKDHTKQVRDEFIAKYRQDPEEFRRRFAPITSPHELEFGLTEAQAGYIQWLVHGHEQVFVDTTRCQFKLQSLHRIFPQATIIHLYRSPENFASSHLLPRRNGGRIQDRLHTLRDRCGFFQRRSRYNSWGMEEIINSIVGSPLSDRFEALGIKTKELRTLPAHAKVMAYWWVVFQELEATGRRLFGERFISLPFGEFCRAPKSTLRSILPIAGFAVHEIDVRTIHAESRPYLSQHRIWCQSRRRLGIPADLLRGNTQPP